MESIIQVFRMTELSVETRINIIIQLGIAVNHEYAANITGPLVYELVIALDPSNNIKDNEHYTHHLKDNIK